MPALPDLPPTVRILSDAESDRLKRLNPGLWADPESKCITCFRKGSFKSRSGEQVECNCVDQWVLHRFLLNAGIGLHYQRLDWDDLDSQVSEGIQVAVMEYAQSAQQFINAGLGMIISGTPGTGKTLLAVLLLKNLLRQGYDCYFTQFNQMLDDYSSGWRDKDDKEWFVRRITNARVLVVDDIGRESKGRDNVATPMFDQVIRSRVANARPTIITTNYSKEEMQSGYGPNVMSLLAERSIEHSLQGPDYRPKANVRTTTEVMSGVVRPVVLA